MQLIPCKFANTRHVRDAKIPDATLPATVPVAANIGNLAGTQATFDTST